MVIDDVLAADDCVGVLTREVRVRLVNISASGCLIESSTRLEPGTAGDLRIRVGGDIVRRRRANRPGAAGAGRREHVARRRGVLVDDAAGDAVAAARGGRLRQVLAQQAVDIEFSSRPM